ncbi:MAG: hypothetical protein DVB31_03710 [Verrucomicrobia bacterium]|nr:MAG: hypothetical protein DVB31_03710 [Verrucomicrobiota bacterium]
MRELATPASLLAALLAVVLPTQAHEHVAAGAASTDPGTPLLFASDDDFGAASGYVFTLETGADARYAGFYHGELIMVALPATPGFGGPDPQHAALGSRVEAVLESVTGPAGGSFGFWETPGNDLDAEELTFSAAVGETHGTHRFPVSENDGQPGADPYGHIHGRVYSATRPGLYKVGFRFVDTSANGPGGGPIHAPSERFYLNFQAGLTIAGVAPAAGGIDVTFAATAGKTLQLETSPSIAAVPDWKPIGDAIAGDDHLHTVTAPTDSTAFFRLVAR